MLRSLHSAASGMEAQQTNIDVIANNMANVNTTAFKKSRAEFQDLFYQELQGATRSDGDGGLDGKPNPIELGHGTRLVSTQKMFSSGSLKQTNNEMDLAVEGQGFFRVRMQDGQIGYTRAGDFKVTAEGQMVTSQGRPLDPPVHFPPETQRVTVEGDGTVKAHLANTVAPQQVGRLELSQFVNPGGLHSEGHGLYLETEGSGGPIEGVPGESGLGTVAQGMLETSNVQVVEEMIDLIAAQRAYEMNSRVIRAADEMLGQAANLR